MSAHASADHAADLPGFGLEAKPDLAPHIAALVG